MNREDFLKRIREDSECNDPYEKEISSFSWKMGAIVAVALSFIIYFFEWLCYDRYNLGLFVAILTMLAIKFIIEAIKIKRTSNIVFSIAFSFLAVVATVFYIIAFMNGWF